MRFYLWMLLAVGVIALVVANAAGGMPPTVSPTAQAFVAAYVDRPITISCDANTVPPPGMTPPTPPAYVEGWVYPTGSVMHLHPSVCLGLASPDLYFFARSFNVLAHETWHLAGRDFDESCAETFARVVVFDAPRYWRLTPDEMLTVADGVSDHTEFKPLAYRAVGEVSCLLTILPRLEGARP